MLGTEAICFPVCSFYGPFLTLIISINYLPLSQGSPRFGVNRYYIKFIKYKEIIKFGFIGILLTTHLIILVIFKIKLLAMT